MNVYSIPEVFEKHSDYLKSDNSSLGIKFYSHKKDMIKANVILDRNLIVFVLEGEKIIYHQSQKFVINAFEGALLKKGSYLMTEHIRSKGNYKAILFFFDHEEALMRLRTNLNPKKSKNLPNLLKLKGNKLLKGFLNSMSDYPEMIYSEKDQYLLDLKFSELFHILHKSNPMMHDHFQDLKRNKKSDLFRLMQINLTENLTLDQYAFLAGLSVSTFKRRFQEYFEQSPRTWITERRLELAYQLLGNTQESVSEICGLVGYDNPSHFIKMFRLRFGETPNQLRMSQKR